MNITEAHRQYQHALEAERTIRWRSDDRDAHDDIRRELRDAEVVLVDAWVVWETDGWTHAR